MGRYAPWVHALFSASVSLSQPRKAAVAVRVHLIHEPPNPRKRPELMCVTVIPAQPSPDEARSWMGVNSPLDRPRCVASAAADACRLRRHLCRVPATREISENLCVERDMFDKGSAVPNVRQGQLL